MTNLFRNRLWFIAVLALSSNFCFAQLQFSFDFTNTTITPLIDMNGVFQVGDQIIGGGGVPVAFNYGVPITHDSRGVLRGSGGTLVQIGDDVVAAAYRANGRVSGGGNNSIQVFLAVTMRGEDVIGGVLTRFSVSVAYHLTFNPDTASLEGSSRGKVTIARDGTSRIASDDISTGIPSGGDGSWTLNVTAVPLNKMVGSSQIIISGGRPVNAVVSGHFDPDTVSVARLVGINGDRGSASTISFTVTDDEVVLETIQGRILGQRVLQ
jgi:hypothetical protein